MGFPFGLAFLPLLQLLYLAGYPVVVVFAVGVFQIIFECGQLFSDGTCVFFFSLCLTNGLDGLFDFGIGSFEQLFGILFGLLQNVFSFALQCLFVLRIVQ